ncbi:MAG: serpin family protein [Syntrophobacteraceae bacterium]|nr:serpin family protein [Syntrophobacteraceae bacterium]
MERAVDGNTAFALQLYRKLGSTEDNLFLSPFSISTALAMTYAGARGNTAKEMAEALHFSLEGEELHSTFAALKRNLLELERKAGVRLKVANALWPQKGYPFLREYLGLVERYYGTTATPVDYARATEQARQTINQWVERETEQKIKDLIPSGILNPLTRLVLTNGIYFKGDWASQFKKSATHDAPFYGSRGSSINVPMMTQQHRFRYGERDDLQILELPYAGKELSLVVLLPRRVDGLPELERALTPEGLADRTGHLQEREVVVFLPKFKLTSLFRVDAALKVLGMEDAFSPERADFAGMDGKPHWLYIGAVLHKAFVDVNEEGTEAAAATGVVVGITSARVQPPMFRADHPFVFLIRDNQTGSILFMGRVVDPTRGG